jgi:diguanylate cyclase (GGDEF)-like protein
MKPSIILIIGILIALLIAPLGLNGVKYPIINYQNSDGLPQNNINTLIQDRMGYIFIGTQSGIGKFDGNRFEVITKKDGLPNNYINHFEMDAEGGIWIATQEGLAKIDARQNYRIVIDSSMPSGRIRFLEYDRTASTLWIIAEDGVYYLKDNKFSRYPPLDYTFNESEDQEITGLAISDSGVKYFYSRSRIIEIKNIDDRKHTISCPWPINFLKRLNKKIIVGAQTGLYLLSNHRLVPYIDLPPGYRDVSGILEDRNGRTWVGTPNGLRIYDQPPAVPIIITSKNGLASERIRTLIIDREQNVFVGTMWGLSQVPPNLFTMYDESDGLPSKFVWGYIEDDENDEILIACDGGIVRLEAKNGEITPFASLNRQFGGHSFRTITKLGKNDYLLGTRNHGIYRWNRPNRPKMIQPKAGVISSVKTTGPGNRPIVWFGTDDGLLKYDGLHFQRFSGGLKDKYIWATAALDDQTLLVGTTKGVQVFNIAEEKFVPSELERHINRNTLVNDIQVISPAEILVATELNGLYIYKGNRLDRLTTANGLLHNDVWSVVKDNAGSIWLNTSVSLARYQNGFISHFNKKTGLFGDEGSIHAAFKASSGKIYFSITPGLLEIPVRQNELEIEKPLLHIKEIKINNKSVPFPETQPLHLKYNQKNIDFYYIAVSTRKENPILYKTRLYPQDTEWSEPTRETHIKYLNLSPDDYTFEVIANNGGGEWFKSGNQITLVIESPFWLTWWFISLAAILVIYLVFLVVRVRLNRLEKQKKQLENLVQQRTEELKHLSITDPLTGLKNRRYLEEKIKEDISLIERDIYERTKRPGRKSPDTVHTLGVFILDIDYFKKVNDQYGHKAGDRVIVDIAHLLREILRSSDTIVRWGGEEFLIITRHYGRDKTFELAERIRKKVESFEFQLGNQLTLQKTVSVGFTPFPLIPDDIRRANWSHVLSLADSALYIAKNSGRNVSVGIECGKRPLDIDFKKIVADIKMGIDQDYLEIISGKEYSELKIVQHNI